MNWLKVLLSPFTFVWFLIIETRHTLYNRGILPKFKTTKPVLICIGNLEFGGTGKTPFTKFLISKLEREYKIGVLSRGYGRKTKGLVIVGQREKLSPDIIGDEPYEIHTTFPKMPLAVCEDRKTGIMAMQDAHPELDIIILDDAFQHRKVQAHINILLSPFKKPYFKNSLAPGGTLRDTKSSIFRADFLLVSKGPQETPRAVMDEFHHKTPFAFDKNLFFTHILYSPPKLALGFISAVKEIRNVVVVSGLANPSPFLEYAKNNWNVVGTFSFKDHHSYSLTDIESIHEIFSKFAASETCVLTTDKDLAKISKILNENNIQMNLASLPIRLGFTQDQEEIFISQLQNQLAFNGLK